MSTLPRNNPTSALSSGDAESMDRDDAVHHAMHKLSKRSKSWWRSKLARHPRVACALKKLSKCYNTYEPYVYLVIVIIVQIAARMQIVSSAPLLFRDTSALANLAPSVREYLGMSGIPGKQLTADGIIAAVLKMSKEK